jgi:hypothetical protein
MEVVLVEVGKWFVSQGLTGIAALMLGWRLYQRETEISTIMKDRLADNRENIKALTESTNTLRQVAEAQYKAADSTRDLAESMRSLESEISRVLR